MDIKRLLELSGFCNYHFWEFERLGSHYGSAGISAGLIEKIIDNFWNHENRIGAKCPICEDLKANESEYIKGLIFSLDSHENKIRYTKGWGLCIPHLVKATADTNDASLVSFLFETEKSQLERVKLNSMELIRKKNAPLRWEQTEDEKNSYFRAIEKLIGRRGHKNE